MKYIFYGGDEYEKLLTEKIPQISHATSFYTKLQRDYQHKYLGNKLVRDLSFFMGLDGADIVAFVPLYLCQVDNRLEFSYIGEDLLAPLFFIPETMGIRSRVESAIFEKIEELAKEHKVKVHKAAIEAYEVIKGTTYHNFLRKYSYQDNSTSTQILALKEDLDDIWLKARKSYRPLINKAKGKYKSVVIDETNWDHDSCEQYRKLHILAAGCETRSASTFEKMYEMIKAGQAFLVGVMSDDGNWLGSYLFYRFNGLAYYSSAATHPDANQKDGINHFGIWRAIEYAKSRNDRWLELGWQPFPDNPEFDEKEDNIAMFKRGFGGQRVALFRGIKHFTN